MAAKGIIISPAYQEVQLTSSAPSVATKISFTNQTQVDRNFRLSTADFGSLDESGGVAFLGQPGNELEHRYGLVSWMRLSTDTLFLPAGEKREVIVTIENRASLAPGGHYGAVLATSSNDTTGTGAGTDVSVKQVLSALVLLTKDGGGNPQLALVSQFMNGQLWRLPSVVDQRYQNSGNLHLVPRGTVEITSPTGKVVRRAVINEGSGVILPESFRRYKTSFMVLAGAWMPGIYRVTTSYRYDGTEQTVTKQESYLYMGQAISWLIIALICSLFAVGLWWFFVRRKNRVKT